jgi:hypothetical protein
MSAGARPGRPRAVVITVRCLSGVDAAVEGDDLVGQVGLGEDGRGEVGDLGWLAEPVGRYLARSSARSPGSILVSATSAGAEVTRPRRCAGSQRADRYIPGLPPVGLCRDDRPGRQSRPGLMPVSKVVRALPQTHVNGTALHQASHIPGSRGFLPIFLPEEATQRCRGALSPGQTSRME